MDCYWVNTEGNKGVVLSQKITQCDSYNFIMASVKFLNLHQEWLFYTNNLWIYRITLYIRLTSTLNRAAAAKSAAVVSDSVRPHSWQPTRLRRAWNSPGKNTGLGCHFLLQCRKMKSESEVTQSCPTLSDPWTAAYQAFPSMAFSRQEYWSGVPLPSSEMRAL